MGKGMTKQTWVLSILKLLLFMYIITGILLVILAGMLCKLQLSESVVAVGIVLIYVISGFLGGFLGGKIMQNQKISVGNGIRWLLLCDFSNRLHFIHTWN